MSAFVFALICEGTVPRVPALLPNMRRHSLAVIVAGGGGGAAGQLTGYVGLTPRKNFPQAEPHVNNRRRNAGDRSDFFWLCRRL